MAIERDIENNIINNNNNEKIKYIFNSRINFSGIWF